VPALLAEYAVLPLGLPEVHARVTPHRRGVLLFGAPRTGKSSLARAVAAALGARLFDLSPTVTDGRYPGGKQANALCVHTAFKCARLHAPSVILVDHAEKLLSGNKKLQARWAAELGLGEPANRLKKDFVKELKTLRPGDQVLVLGITAAPFDAVKKDRKALVGAFQRHLHVPLPGGGDRAALWEHFFRWHGCSLRGQGVDVGLLATLSEGLAAGDIERVARAVLTPDRLLRARAAGCAGPGGRAALEAGGRLTTDEVVAWLAAAPRLDRASEGRYLEWAAGLPGRGGKPAKASKKKK